MLKRQIPTHLHGIPLRSKTSTWHASALSSFGIFYNKRLLTMLKIPFPKTWDDLGKPEFFGHISNADVRLSSSFAVMNYVILLSAKTWEQGWDNLTRIAANSKKFAHSSSDPIKSVVANRTGIGLSVGYFVRPKIEQLGADNLGFVLPPGKTILNADPISIIKNCKNRLQASRFLNFILSPKAQKLLILPKGAVGGPKFSTLGRMAVNRVTYKHLKPDSLISPNPFLLDSPTFKLDLTYLQQTQFVIADLIGTVLIDLHSELKSAWKRLIKAGLNKPQIRKMTTPPISAAEMIKLAPRWQDASFRNKTINQWYESAKNKYADIGK